ncbi:glycogen debranching protein GlgX [Gammaproteobacteria bacterium]|nr:glycogen debranching protein GlgX [Gammaproteobacteria bacterium]
MSNSQPIDNHRLSGGCSVSLGATPDERGVNFAVFSAHAERIEVCLFDDNDHQYASIPLSERDGDVWHTHVAGLDVGTRYGLRADGAFAPSSGHRFNPNKLLIDPYAREWDRPAVFSPLMRGDDPLDVNQLDPRDSAAVVPKAIVVRDAPIAAIADRHRWRDTVIYEAHLKGLTQLNPAVADSERGRYAGIASDAMIEHYQRLGITAIELLPIHAFIDDSYLVQRGLSNYWGYQSVGFFAAEVRYAQTSARQEFQSMVQRLHDAGIEVILDVVYNHSGEENERGSTLSFRGLDNRSYYRLADDRRHYLNFTGTGNTFDLRQPMVLRMVMDSLRYWVEVMGVDGFRFDLATTLARTGQGFDTGSSFLQALRQDPILRRAKLIAEPWDIGPGGYQLGAWPHPVHEWNDRFRDTVRRFWRGDDGEIGRLAGVLLGTAERFDHHGRAASSSINFLTAHDGFTLDDLVSYHHKHNEANGEGNADGHGENYSDNMGVEGPSDSPEIAAARKRRKRAMLATLLLSQGTPMLLAGDELGHSQQGNNNAYCQDNPTGWIDWQRVDDELIAYVQQLIALRRRYPLLRQHRFLHGNRRASDGLCDLIWRHPDGSVMQAGHWQQPHAAALCVEMRGSADAPPTVAIDDAMFVIVNRGSELRVQLPPLQRGQIWCCVLDSTHSRQSEWLTTASEVQVAAHGVMLFSLQDAQSA